MAKVLQTDADVYLHDYAPIFMYHTQSRALYYAWFDEEADYWECFRNGRLIQETCRFKPFIAHWDLQEVIPGCDMNQDNYIKGRISPSGLTIYVHSMGARDHRVAISRRFDYAVNKAIRKIRSYMKPVLN